jgi:hypothetical protein
MHPTSVRYGSCASARPSWKPKLKRLYGAIKNGSVDVSDPMLKERVTELKAIGFHESFQRLCRVTRGQGAA